MLTDIILKFLEAGEATSDLIFSGYAESYRKMRGIQQSEKIDFKKIERQRFHSLISKLHKEGLVKKKKGEGLSQSLWSITKRGIKKLNLIRLKNKQAGKMPTLKIIPLHQKDFLKVIAFDIPERDKKKRNWLRLNLINLGFEKLQKSVWVGDEKLPEDFFRHLRELKLIPCVHIFAVSKSGSINHKSY